MPKKRTATSSTKKGDVSSEITLPGEPSTNHKSAYGLRRADLRKKPSRYVEVSPPVTKKPRRKRKSASTMRSGKRAREPAEQNTAQQHSVTPEKKVPMPDWYCYSPPPMRLVHREERDGYSISYFDDPEPIPGQNFNSIYQYKYPQLKKTKSVWVKANKGLFDTTWSSTSSSAFKVPDQSSITNTERKGKRKADDTEIMTPTDLNAGKASIDGQAVKRQRIDCSVETGSASAVTNSSLFRATNSTAEVKHVTSKRKVDEMESATSGISLENVTQITRIKRQRVEFQLEDSDVSFVSSSSKNESFQSVSDIFNFSFGSEMNNTADSVGLNISLESSFNRSFNTSYSHLKELI